MLYLLLAISRLDCVMNKQTEALKMAIEALSQDEGWFEPEAAIKACKDALAQPASKNIRDSFNKMLEDKVAYYKGKQPAQEYLTRAQQVIRANNSAQEPVAWNEEEFNAIAYAYRTCPAHEIKMVIETLFSLDGLGLLSYEAVIRRDYPLVLGTLYLFT